MRPLSHPIRAVAVAGVARLPDRHPDARLSRPRRHCPRRAADGARRRRLRGPVPRPAQREQSARPGQGAGRQPAPRRELLRPRARERQRGRRDRQARRDRPGQPEPERVVGVLRPAAPDRFAARQARGRPVAGPPGRDALDDRRGAADRADLQRLLGRDPGRDLSADDQGLLSTAHRRPRDDPDLHHLLPCTPRWAAARRPPRSVTTCRCSRRGSMRWPARPHGGRRCGCSSSTASARPGA